MPVSREDMLETISQMSIMDIVELIKSMEDKFGVSAAAVTMAAPAAAANVAAQEEQTEFTVILEQFGDNKINVIKAVREITSLGLKEAKDLVEAAPKPIKESIPKAQAEEIKKKLEDAGAKVGIK